MPGKELLCPRPFVIGKENDKTLYPTLCKKDTPFGIQCCVHSFNTTQGQFSFQDDLNQTPKILDCMEDRVGRYVQKCSEKQQDPSQQIHASLNSLDYLTCPLKVKTPLCRPDTKGGIACCIARKDLTVIPASPEQKDAQGQVISPEVKKEVYFPFVDDNDSVTKLSYCFYDVKAGENKRQAALRKTNNLQCYQNSPLV